MWKLLVVAYFLCLLEGWPLCAHDSGDLIERRVKCEPEREMVSMWLKGETCVVIWGFRRLRALDQCWCKVLRLEGCWFMYRNIQKVRGVFNLQM